MTIQSRSSGAPAHGRPGPDPLQMTELEKRMAEAEARHDVAARGRRAAPDVVQHYCAHERVTQACRAPRAGAPAARQRGRTATEKPPSRLQILFSRLF
ncbi:hypothetical protein DQ244_12295 [Blastococcus sp. TBT05-19]|uniref:hypothetical protein n=1 Tax=Blastococcus sp. TBT05-19 TaxID=2250581 RepID=UPI000DE9B045|nr:hypothetical protein [Blastococcus sp. TBT05-19]RBY90240.1 hypothetical protein DQ244_12295 [Blastococcus sp. TBT05-19]